MYISQSTQHRFAIVLWMIGLLLVILMLPARDRDIVDAATALQVGDAVSYMPLVMYSPAPAIRVKSSRMYLEEDAVDIVGEVVNDSSVPVIGVEVEARFFNGEQRAGTAKGFGLIQSVDPGQRCPFFILLHAGGPPAVTRYELSVIWISGVRTSFRRATVLSTDARVHSDVEVVSRLQNDHPQSLRDVRSTAVFYDQADSVIWVALGLEPIDVLAPSATADYRITTFRPETWSRLAIFSEGRIEQ